MAVIEKELTSSRVATESPRTPRLWSRDEYYRLAEAGILGSDERVELIRGVIENMAPIGPEHSDAGLELYDMLREAAPVGIRVMHERSVNLGDKSEPQPDLVVARGDRKTYMKRHPVPSDIILVVETSNTSLLADQTVKQQLYAEAAIPEYWIVNLVDQQVEVYTKPTNGGYESKRLHHAGEAVELSFALGTSIAVSDILGASETRPEP
jgi:Uma2 family endonuclease